MSLKLWMTPVEMVHKLRRMKLRVDVQRRQGMCGEMLLRIDWWGRHVRLHNGVYWWVEVVIAVDEVLLLLVDVR